MLTIYVNRNGKTDTVEHVEPSWLDPSSDAKVWVDLAAPTPEEFSVLTDVFHFHPLAIEDAVAKVHHPKIESYDGYLYLILHGIDYKKSQTAFATHDIDFFLGHTYLVTVHDGQTRGVPRPCGSMCSAGTSRCSAKAPRRSSAPDHRPDGMDNYRPEVEELRSSGSMSSSSRCSSGRLPDLTKREILDVKRDVTGAAPDRAAAEGRCGPPGAPRISGHHRRVGVPLS